MSVRIPFSLNTIVLIPLLRSLPPAAGLSFIAVLLGITGLDFGLLRLGAMNTAADQLVAWMMTFSVCTLVLWPMYMLQHAWKWAIGFVAHMRARFGKH